MFITVAAQKGAQTKTSTAVNLAAALALSRPGTIVDIDSQQQDATRYEGSVANIHWTQQIPARARVGEFVVVDTPPQVVDATGVAFSRSDLILIPCTPQAASLESLARTFETIEIARRKNQKLVAVVVFTCVDRSQYAAGVMAAAGVLSMWPVTKTFVPSRPIVTNAPKSAGATAYKQLAQEVETILGK